MNKIEKNPSQEEINILINFIDQNKLDEAQIFLKNLINNFNSSAFLYNISGIIFSKKNNINNSIDAFKKAIALDENFIDAYYNLGIIVRDLSVEESINNFEKVIKLDKRNINSLTQLGILYLQKKNFLKAKFFFEKAVILDSSSSDAHNNMGNILFELELFNEAKASYLKAISLNKDSFFAYNNLGRVLKEQNLFTDSIDCFNKAILLNPHYIDGYNNLAIILNENEMYNESKDVSLKLIKINPKYANAYCHLGDSYRGLGNFDMAINNHEKSIELNPNYLDAYNSLGLDYLRLFEYSKSIDLFRKAININENDYQAYNNLAQAYHETQNFSLAKSFYQKSTFLKKNFVDGYYNASMIYLLEDNYKKGWFLHDYRWSVKKPKIPSYNLDKKYWDGNFLEGSLLVWSEQGVGDIIFFGSMVSELKVLAKQIIFETDKRLINLFSRYFLEQNIKNIKVKELMPSEQTLYDRHIPIGSLGKFFRNNIDDFKKAPKKFLVPDNNRCLFFNNQNLKYNKKIKIGLSWKTGNIKEGYRNILLKDLYPILSDERFCFFNLQFGDSDKEIQDTILDTSVNLITINHLDTYNNLEDLSALINDLDLVITIQNTTAHLSGALGKKTFLLLSKNHRWQWGLNHENSIWYPSIKIFRQKTFKVWDDVVKNIHSELNKLTKC
jgi:tetratricopeptide (TPR) repeat protein